MTVSGTEQSGSRRLLTAWVDEWIVSSLYQQKERSASLTVGAWEVAPDRVPTWEKMELGEWEPDLSFSLPLLCRPEAPNEFYDGDHDNDKESDVEI